MSPLREVSTLFLRLGFTAFGGPPAHIALLEEETVTRRKWLDRQHFLDLVSAVNFIPGPNSTELSIHLGYLRAGYPGLLAAGVCFVTPAVLIILPIAYAYVTYGQLPQSQHIMAAINATTLAIIAHASLRLIKSTLTSPFPVTIAILAALASLLTTHFSQFQPDLLILLTAALVGILRARAFPKRLPTLLLFPTSLFPTSPLLASATPMTAPLLTMCLQFLKIGATLFGSGYVLISYLQVSFVDQLHFLTQRQLLDSIAVGQLTPGPLLTTSTFIGYLLGHSFSHGSHPVAILAAVAATLSIFLPSFLFVALLAPYFQKLRTSPIARAALTGMAPAVLALIFTAASRLAPPALHSWPTLTLFAASLATLLLTRLNPTYLIAASALLGLLTSL